MKYAIVPIEATEEMVRTAFDATNDQKCGDVDWLLRTSHSAMLAASPNGGKISREQFRAAFAAVRKNNPYRLKAYLTRDLMLAFQAIGLEVGDE